MYCLTSNQSCSWLSELLLTESDADEGFAAFAPSAFKVEVDDIESFISCTRSSLLLLRLVKFITKKVKFLAYNTKII